LLNNGLINTGRNDNGVEMEPEPMKKEIDPHYWPSTSQEAHMSSQAFSAGKTSRLVRETWTEELMKLRAERRDALLRAISRLESLHFDW
jgi:hypothetical protein